MRNVEKIAAIASAALFVCLVLNAWLGATIVGFAAPPKSLPPGEYISMLNSLMLVRGMITMTIHIAIAVWLYRRTAGIAERPWVWGVFGFMFGLVAPILFCFSRVAARRGFLMSGAVS